MLVYTVGFFGFLTTARGIRVDVPVPILSNKRKLMIGIILVCVPVGFIVRASLLKLFQCRSIESDFPIFNLLSC